MSPQTNGTAKTAKKAPISSKSISSKAAYSRSAGKKLAEAKAKLEGINAKIRNAVATGKIDGTEQLWRAQQAVVLNLETAQAQLSRLRKSDEESWEDRKKDVEDSWEHLSRSIKSLADRFSDGLSMFRILRTQDDHKKT